MATTSGRIDIVGQNTGGCCDTSEITISRSKPAMLEGYLNDFSWKSFCDKMDEALNPVSKAKKTMTRGIAASMGVGFTFIVIGFILFASQSAKTVNSFGAEGNIVMAIIPFVLGMAIVMGGSIGFGCWASSVAGNVRQEMKKVCEETSGLHPGVSFHVRDEMRFWTSYGGSYGGGYGGGYGGYNDGYGGYRHGNVHSTTTNYIEVYVSSTASGAMQGYASSGQNYIAPAAPSAPPKYPVTAAVESDVQIIPAHQVHNTPKERMRELDNLRGLLTEDEYQTKRAEILSDV